MKKIETKIQKKNKKKSKKKSKKMKKIETMITMKDGFARPVRFRCVESFDPTECDKNDPNPRFLVETKRRRRRRAK
jgi:hypothetical protein